MSKIYHSTKPITSFAAFSVWFEHNDAVEAVGGTMELPETYIEDAIIVLTLPEGVTPESVVPGVEFVEVNV